MGYEKINSLEYFGEDQTIDLEVEHKDHTFYANDISVSNSHSVGYAFNSYQCAWLYTYYEKEWVKACLECDPDLQSTIFSVRLIGYEVEKPNVNKSAVNEWFIEEKQCIPALTSLKGLGEAGAGELVSNRPEGGFKNLNDFFYDGEKWRYSKLNKRCLEVLCKMEAFSKLPGAIGTQGVFKNHAHLCRALIGVTEKVSKRAKNGVVCYDNIDLLKKQKIDFDQLALETDSVDWTVAEKVQFQRDIVGFYDKSLVVNKFFKVFEEFNIDAIDECPDETDKKRIWAIVDNVEQKVSKNNKTYLIVGASGISNKEYRFRVWRTSKDKTQYWVVGNILYFSLKFEKQWGYSVPFSSKILQINK